MEKKERIELYRKATRKWGVESQLNMFLEESLELALAVRKMIRNNTDLEFQQVVSEIADVEIMIEQFTELYGDIEIIRGLIEHEKKFKLERLQKRLEQ